MMATSNLDVEARSDAYSESRSARMILEGVLGSVHLSSVLLERRQFFKCCLNIVFGKVLGLRYLLVDFFGIVLFGLK